ncbi:MAG: family 10 glycosylhydrolase [Sandaracinaceae bacterium]|nr:family 10 glycosylhydrolase [Sandaracinaceae bacterium]
MGHERELRAAWVASVFNITWPSRNDLSVAASRAEIARILDLMAALRMNAAVVQIRPESDALYRSSIEPWSRFLTGTQGTDPGWDPLAVWIEEAHARGIELHAWMNPYRGMASASATTAATHVTRTLSPHAHPWSTTIWMDPGASEVRAHVVSVVRDVVGRYDVDGIHFDDYFYPYPDGTRTFPDDATYDAYLAAGGALSPRGLAPRERERARARGERGHRLDARGRALRHLALRHPPAGHAARDRGPRRLRHPLLRRAALDRRGLGRLPRAAALLALPRRRRRPSAR